MNKSVKLPKKPSLENEVISAVIVLYLFIVAIIYLTHVLQPPEQETLSSSASPTHQQLNAPSSGAAP